MPVRKLESAFHERPWGATELEPWFPKSVTDGRTIGEVWHEVPSDLPLLVKFIFTSEPLSVQVHPNDEYAAKHHNSPGKTEMWHILSAKPGAKIAAGFRDAPSKERVRRAAQASTFDEMERMLTWFDAAPGDTFFIPAGVMHAIGAGLVLCEIQQASDVTYRVYDYGRGRELHLDHALEVARLEPHEARAKIPVSSDYFVTSRMSVHGTILYRPMTQRPQMLIAIEGEGTIDGQPLKAGDVWYLSGDSAHVAIVGEVTLLRALVPVKPSPAD